MITPQWLTQQFPQLTAIAPLAEAGQKWVYSASHPTDGDVVLKLIKPTTDGERVRREILAVQQIASPRIPAVRETGILPTALGDLIWLREQRVNGESVRQTLQSGPLAPDAVLTLGLHVLEALHGAETARIVHRDVKPENVMRGNDGRFWLLDFGIARHLDLVSVTATAALGGVGTVGYAPPEQYRNKKREIDARADLFALGVTMVECLTGRHPFRDGARDVPEVLRRIENTPLVVPVIPGDKENRLAELLRAMTQRRLDCRPPNSGDALAWLKDVTISP